MRLLCCRENTWHEQTPLSGNLGGKYMQGLQHPACLTTWQAAVPKNSLQLELISCCRAIMRCVLDQWGLRAVDCNINLCSKFSLQQIPIRRSTNVINLGKDCSFLGAPPFQGSPLWPIKVKKTRPKMEDSNK